MGYRLIDTYGKPVKIFQFPLWDTKSLLFIPNIIAICLSIPFMGYKFLQKTFLQKTITFNSLYGILQ